MVQHPLNWDIRPAWQHQVAVANEISVPIPRSSDTSVPGRADRSQTQDQSSARLRRFVSKSDALNGVESDRILCGNRMPDDSQRNADQDPSPVPPKHSRIVPRQRKENAIAPKITDTGATINVTSYCLIIEARSPPS